MLSIAVLPRMDGNFTFRIVLNHSQTEEFPPSAADAIIFICDDNGEVIFVSYRVKSGDGWDFDVLGIVHTVGEDDV